VYLTQPQEAVGAENIFFSVHDIRDIDEQFFLSILEQARALPGVISVGLTDFSPRRILRGCSTASGLRARRKRMAGACRRHSLGGPARDTSGRWVSP
jgi:hypothetical protein